jgi:hypothetical protein
MMIPIASRSSWIGLATCGSSKSRDALVASRVLISLNGFACARGMAVSSSGANRSGLANS